MLQSPERTRLEMVLSRLMPLWAACMAVPTLLYVLVSMRWGIEHDAPLLYFIGRNIAEGARPVADVFDMNLPLVYWLHALIYRLFGLDELAWRLIDLAVLGVICLLGYRIIRPGAGPFAAAAALWIIAHHISGGPYLVGERDVAMLALVLAAGLALIRIAERGIDDLTPLGAGVLLGIAVMLKPTAIIYPPLMLAAVIAVEPRLRKWSSLVPLFGWVAVGGALPCGAVLLVLHAQGVLPQFIEMWTQFLLPVYGKVTVSWSEMGEPLTRVSLAAGIVAVIAVYGAGLPRLEPRIAIVVAVTIGGMAGYLAQGKGWVYQAAPFCYALILLTGVLAAQAWNATSRIRTATGIVIPLLTINLALEQTVDMLMAYSKLRHAPRTPSAFVTHMIGDLDRIADRSVPVQAFDTTHGAIDALVRTGRYQPTRFIYDFQFFIGQRSAYREQLRTEFLVALDAAAPHLLIVTNQQWPEKKPGFDRVDNPELWPDFHRLLNEKYRLVVERSVGLPDDRQYRIYRTAP